MWVYFSVYLLVSLAVIRNNKRSENILYVLLLLFLCFGYMCGSDWRVYELQYDRITSVQEALSRGWTTHEEIGYNVLVGISNTLGLGFWPFHIILKCLVFTSLMRAIRLFDVRYSEYFLLYFATACSLFIDCPFRNLIALGIFAFSLPYLNENKPIKYFICCALASVIHLAALVTIPIYFIYRKKTVMNTIIVSIIIVFLYIFVFVESNLLSVINSVMEYNEYASERLSGYAESSSFTQNTINIVTVFNMIVYIIVLFFKEKIEKQKGGAILLNIFFVYQMIIPLSTAFRMFSRFSVFFGAFFPIIVIYLFRGIVDKFLRVSIIGFVLAFTLARLSFDITNDSRYIPYSNYLQYIGNHPSYYERDAYNPKNSPYKDFR